MAIKTDRITELIAISLLITIFNLPTTSATDLPDGDVVRIDTRIFHYSDPANQPTKEVVFAITDGVRNIYSFAGEFLTGLYNEYNRKGNYAATFSDNLTACMRDQRIKVETCLRNAHELDAAKTLLLFDGICRRIFSLYQPFFASIDRLHKEFQSAPISSDFSKGRHAFFPGDIGTISLTRGQEALQCALFQDLSNLQSEMMLARALALAADKLDNFQLLLYITGVAQISLGNKLHVVNPAISGLYSAYGNPAPGILPIPDLEQLAANHLRIVDVAVPGKVEFSLAEKDDWCEIAVKQEDDIQLTKAKIIGKAAKVAAPAAKVIRMFTKEDDRMLAEITDTDAIIQTSLQKTGRTPAGYTQNEAIMDYGANAGKSSITQQMRDNVSSLLETQLARRGMTPKQFSDVEYKSDEYGGHQKLVDAPAVVAILKDWVKSLKIVNVDAANKSLDYTLDKSTRHNSLQNTRFIGSLWTLYQMHSKYITWLKPTEKEAFLEAIIPLLTQSLTHLEDHFGRCDTGAKGRIFLVELGMLGFFRDAHPNLEITA